MASQPNPHQLPETLNVVIASYLEPEYIDQIRSVDPRLNVLFPEELRPAPRYACDHVGTPPTLSPEEQQRWRDLLASAHILFDFDGANARTLPEMAPNLLWLQATSAGIGQFVKRMEYDTRLPNTIFTTASGVHAVPLAEFCMMSMLVHFRNFALMQADQRAHRWERFATSDLRGKTVAVVGLGRIGSEVARLSKAFGMRVIGTRARGEDSQVDEFFPPERLHDLLAQADVVVVIVPHTPQTEQLIGAQEFAVMKQGAYFINIARGAVVDEPALIEALQSGHLGGAALDVFAVEPLPAASPLWEMPNVIICPHSASTSDRENALIVDLFCDNLRRFLDGRPLRNVLDTERLY